MLRHAPTPSETTSAPRRPRLVSGDYGRFLKAHVASQAADAITTLTLAQVVVFDIGRGATPGMIARMLVITLLPLALAGPLAGRIADRWSRQRVLAVTSIAKALATAAAATVPLTRSVIAGYVAFAVLLVGTRIVYTTRSAALPSLIPEDRLVSASSFTSLVGMIATSVGGGTAAIVASHAPVMALATSAGLHVATAVGYAPLALGRGQRRRPDDPTPPHGLVAGARELVAHTRVRVAVAAVCAHRFLLAASVVVMALVADARFSFEAGGYAAALGVVGVGSFLGTLATPALVRRLGRDGTLIGSFAVAALFAGGAASTTSAALLLASVGGIGFAFQVTRILTDAVVQSGVSGEVLGRAFASYDIAYTLSFVAAGLTIAPLWSVAGPGTLWTAIAAAYTVGTIVSSAGLHLWRRSRSTNERVIDVAGDEPYLLT